MPIIGSYNFTCDKCGQSWADAWDAPYGYAQRGPDLPPGWASRPGGLVLCPSCFSEEE